MFKIINTLKAQKSVKWVVGAPGHITAFPCDETTDFYNNKPELQKTKTKTELGLSYILKKQKYSSKRCSVKQAK